MGCDCNQDNPFSALSNAITNSLDQQPMPDPVYISKRKLTEFDKLSLLQVAHCIDQAAFRKAFDPYLTNTELNQDDLQKLAKMWESGEDKKNGFSIERAYGSISPNLNTLNRCANIKWID